MPEVKETAAPAGDNNSANYGATLDHARLLGANFKTARDRQRKLAHSLCLAALVDGYALDELIVDAKEAMPWRKLDSSERNRMNVFFTACRTIVGYWPKLTQEQRDQFTAGKLVYSTLVTAIKEAVKAADKAADEADKAEEQAAETAPAFAALVEGAEAVVTGQLSLDMVLAFLDAADADALTAIQTKLDTMREAVVESLRDGTQG